MHTRGLHAGFVVDGYLAHLMRPLHTMHHAQDNDDVGGDVVLVVLVVLELVLVASCVRFLTYRKPPALQYPVYKP
jgi:hypothetical protein